MANYCVNKNPQANGDHEVHNLDLRCPHTPGVNSQVVLGSHPSCQSAVAAAKQLHYPQSNGCYYCARPCHSR